MLCFGRQNENLIQWYSHSHSPLFCELPSAMNHAIGTLDSMHLAKVLNKQTQNLSDSAEITVDFPSPVQFRSVQLLSRVWLFLTPWIAAHQASLSITNSQSLPKLMSIESVMPSNHLILCRPLLLPSSIFPSIRVFSNESALHIRWPKYWSFCFISVLPVNIQGWFPLRLTGLISMQSKGLSIVFFSTTLQKHQFHTWLLEKPSFDYMDFCQQNYVSAFEYAV